MDKRNKIYLITIVLLAASVILKYLFLTDSPVESKAVSNTFISSNDFILHADNPHKTKVIKRNIFSIEQVRYVVSPIIPAKVIKPNDIKKPAVVAEPAVVPQQLDTDVDRIKLLGVVFHDNEKKAFLLFDRERVIASVGDRIYGKFILKNIRIDSVEIADIDSSLTRNINVLGK